MGGVPSQPLTATTKVSLLGTSYPHDAAVLMIFCATRLPPSEGTGVIHVLHKLEAFIVAREVLIVVNITDLKVIPIISTADDLRRKSIRLILESDVAPLGWRLA